MESLEPIKFLPNPQIKANKLDYVEPVKVYSNLFEIKLTKEIKMYQYPFEVNPEIAKENMIIRKKLFKGPQREVKSIYGIFLIDGDSLYSLNKVEDVKIFKTTLRVKKKINEYQIKVNKYENEITINEKDINENPIQKHFIELIIKDILLSNPNVERFKDTYIMLNKKEKIDINENSSVNFYPGFRTSFVETDRGKFLNVVLTHKFIRNENILDYLERFGQFNDKSVQEEINAQLIGRSFKVKYAKKNYQIDEILFDRNPANQDINYDGKTTNLMTYYEKAHQIKIENKVQPLILVRKEDAQGDPLNLYFIPELCNLVGIDDEDVINFNFMKKVSECTKMEPTQKVKETNKFIELFQDSTEDRNTHWSSKKKSEHYGVQINPLKELFNAYYMNPAQLKDGKNKKVGKDNKGDVNLVKNIPMINWIFIYNIDNYDDADFLNNSLQQASGKYHIKINNKPKWIEMPRGSKAIDWINAVNKRLLSEDKYDFVLYLLSEKNNIYPQIKKHSLCSNGYISQVVKVDTLYKKGIMSICSKILLQINAKLGGATYKLDFGKPLAGKRIMVVGVDSSKHKDKNNYGTGIAMVATINDSLTDFYNETKIIKEIDYKDENKNLDKDKYIGQFHFYINNFIEEATKVYEKNNKGNKPDWIIIYRQGVSLEQKRRLKTEIREIDNTCKTKNIKYYYILVNTKSTFKFFEKDEKNVYYNPYSGLLVLDGVINRNFFEFYIQPQEVTQGSATPTCFHVAYGNLNLPEMIPKFTFDLCHLYSNWQGSIRIPHVIKCAEKLSKMTAKYKLNELNKKLEIGQAYL